VRVFKSFGAQITSTRSKLQRLENLRLCDMKSRKAERRRNSVVLERTLSAGEYKQSACTHVHQWSCSLCVGVKADWKGRLSCTWMHSKPVATYQLSNRQSRHTGHQLITCIVEHRVELRRLRQVHEIGTWPIKQFVPAPDSQPLDGDQIRPCSL
jgi:hypothetical protein